MFTALEEFDVKLRRIEAVVDCQESKYLAKRRSSICEKLGLVDHHILSCGKSRR